MSFPVTATPLGSVAVTVTTVETATTFVVAMKVAVVEPAAIETLAGGTTDAWSLLNAIEKPPTGAAELKVSVPVEFVPLAKLLGLNFKLTRDGGFTVRFAEMVDPLSVAVILGVWTDATAWV